MTAIDAVSAPMERALAQVVQGPLGPTDIDPDDIRDQACSVTASTGICSPSPADPPDLPDAPDLPGAGLAATLADLLFLVLVLALVAGLVWLIVRFVRGSRRARSDDDDDVETDLDESVDGGLGARIVDHGTSPGEWRRRADEHAARGDYRDAVRCRYRALVGDLARAGYVDEIAGRTSGEERAQVAVTVNRLSRARPASGDGVDVATSAARVTTSFDRAAGTFDAAWFDDEPVSTDDHDRFVADEEVVLLALASDPQNRRRRAESST